VAGAERKNLTREIECWGLSCQILFARTDWLALQLRVLINPLHCFLQSKVVGGIFSRESLIELSLMGWKVAAPIFGVLSPQGILGSPLSIVLSLK
jgi:hypothetical protein